MYDHRVIYRIIISLTWDLGIKPQPHHNIRILMLHYIIATTVSCSIHENWRKRPCLSAYNSVLHMNFKNLSYF